LLGKESLFMRYIHYYWTKKFHISYKLNSFLLKDFINYLVILIVRGSNIITNILGEFIIFFVNLVREEIFIMHITFYYQEY
jgi:hypothetical protein